MTPVLIFLSLCALFGLVLWGGPALLERRERVRIEALLRAPEIGGIPLPMPDDPRWKVAHPSGAKLGPFHVERCFGRIYFEHRELGTWEAYAKRVFAVFDAAERAAMEKRALAAITGDADK